MRHIALTILLLLTTFAHARQTDSISTHQWRALKQLVSRSPFEYRNQFTVDLTHYGKADWAYPLPNSKVISEYGGQRNHKGIDLKRYGPGYERDTIYAAFTGEVTYSGTLSAYGLLIVMRHANGLETAYSHNSKNLVKAGDWVRAGQPIAIIGRTGRATTEHLHFEVRVNGQQFDSTILIDHKKRRLHPRKILFTKQKNGLVSVEIRNAD